MSHLRELSLATYGHKGVLHFGLEQVDKHLDNVGTLKNLQRCRRHTDVFEDLQNLYFEVIVQPLGRFYQPYMALE